MWEHKLNEMEALNMKQKIWNKLDESKKLSYSSCFKTWLLIRNISRALRKKRNTWEFVFFKKFQDSSDKHLDFKKWLQVFLFDPSFGDTEFYYFSVD